MRIALNTPSRKIAKQITKQFKLTMYWEEGTMNFSPHLIFIK